MPPTFPETKADWNSPTAPTASTNRFRAADWNNLIDQTPNVINVKGPSYGAKGDGVTDDTAALDAAFAAGKHVFLPPGTYKRTTAWALSGSGIHVYGVRGLSILNFTGATDGITLADDGGRDITIENLTISTSNAGAGKAISADCPINAAAAVKLSNIAIAKTGSGMWAYGLYGNFWEVSTIESVRAYLATTTGVFLKNSSNALHFYNLEIVGGTRGIDVDWNGGGATGSEVYVHGGTLQGAFTASVARVGTSSVLTLYSVHAENSVGGPSDGADYVTQGTSAILKVVDGQGASITTAGTTPSLIMYYANTKAVTLGSSTSPSFLFGNNMASLSSAANTTDIVLGNRLNSGSVIPNKLGPAAGQLSATAYAGLTGAGLSATAGYTLANNAALASLDTTGTALLMLVQDASNNVTLRYKTGQQFSLVGSGNRIFANDTLLYLYGPTIINGLAGDGSGAKHKRVTTGSIGGGTRADVTVTWGTTFADANYSAVATVVDTSAAGTGLRVERIRTVAAGSVVVQVMNDAVGAITGTLDVVAFHD